MPAIQLRAQLVGPIRPNNSLQPRCGHRRLHTPVTRRFSIQGWPTRARGAINLRNEAQRQHYHRTLNPFSCKK